MKKSNIASVFTLVGLTSSLGAGIAVAGVPDDAESGSAASDITILEPEPLPPTPEDGNFIGTNGWNVPSFIWEGKTVVNDGTGVINRILGGVHAIPGDVYPGQSIADGSDVIHIDYSEQSPWIGSIIHDEIVADETDPNRWNGVMYFVGGPDPIPLTTFTLEK